MIKKHIFIQIEIVLVLLALGSAKAQIFPSSFGSTPFLATGGSSQNSNATRSGWHLTPQDFGAYGDNINQQMLITSTTAGASTTIDFAVVTNWPVPNFKASDIGKPIEIAGIGTSGAALTTTIAAVNSTTEIVVVSGALTAVSSTQEAVNYGHDDTSALNNWLNSCVTSVCDWPSGYTYRITNQLSIPAYAIVQGVAINPYYYYPGTVGTASQPPSIIMADGFSSSWAGATAIINLGGYDHVEGLSINAKSVSASIPVFYGTKGYNEIWHNYTYGGRYSIWEDFGAPQNQVWSILYNDFSSSTSDCVFIGSTSDNVIGLNWVHSCGGNAMTLSGGGVDNVFGNVLENSTTCGFNIFGGAYAVSFVGNKIENNVACGIFINAFTGSLSATGNTFFSTGGANWRFTGTSTGQIVAAGNLYPPSASTTSYMANANGTPTVTLAPGSAFYEPWVAQATGIYATTALQTALQPYVVPANAAPGPFSAAGAAIPTCATNNKGATFYVSDANGPVTGSSYVSGGAAYASVNCNGSSWIVVSH